MGYLKKEKTKMKNVIDNSKVLVTGGTGMIGRYLVDKLLAKNCKVTVVSLDEPDGLPDEVCFMKLDLTILQITQQKFIRKMMSGKHFHQTMISIRAGLKESENYKQMPIKYNMGEITFPL